MKLLRALLFLLLVSSGPAGGGVFQSTVAAAAAISTPAPAAAEDAATQGRTLGAAYNLLPDGRSERLRQASTATGDKVLEATAKRIGR